MSSWCLDDLPIARFYLGYTAVLTIVALTAVALFAGIWGNLGRYASIDDDKATWRRWAWWAGLVAVGLLCGMGTWSRSCGSSLDCFSFETILRHEVG